MLQQRLEIDVSQAGSRLRKVQAELTRQTALKDKVLASVERLLRERATESTAASKLLSNAEGLVAQYITAQHSKEEQLLGGKDSSNHLLTRQQATLAADRRATPAALYLPSLC